MRGTSPPSSSCHAIVALQLSTRLTLEPHEHYFGAFMQDDVLDTTAHARCALTTPLKQTVFRSSKASRQGLLERVFAFVFDGLVYPQIWEDPAVDIRAMAIEPGHHVVAITSGGCNVLSYLTA